MTFDPALTAVVLVIAALMVGAASVSVAKRIAERLVKPGGRIKPRTLRARSSIFPPPGWTARQLATVQIALLIDLGVVALFLLALRLAGWSSH